MNKKEKGIPILVLIFAVVISIGFPYTAKSQLKPDEPIVVGVPSGLGFNDPYNAWLAIQLAVEEINSKGGVLLGGKKHPIKAYEIDTRDPEPGIPVHDALMAIEKLILEKKPHALLLAPLRSEVLMASMDLVSKYKVPLISSHTMSPMYNKKISENYDKYKYCFRNCFNSDYLNMYMEGFLEFVKKEFGFNKIHIVVQDVMWAKGAGVGVEKWCKEHGREVIGLDAYATGSTDFSPSLIKAKVQKPQVMVALFDMPQSVNLFKQARAMSVPTLICGSLGPSTSPENAWEAYGEDVESVVNIQFCVGSPPLKAIPKSVAYFENFGKRWGKTQRERLGPHGHGASYDSVYVLANAIERAGTLEPDALVSALEKTDLTTIQGRTRFGKDHQAIFGFDLNETCVTFAFQWKKPGIRVPVFPGSVAEGKIELPPYMK